MRSILLVTLLTLLVPCHGATQCKKDTCYSIVASNAANKPPLASRKADCSSILRTVVDDDFVLTRTSFSTAPPVTTTITVTSTSTNVVTTTAKRKTSNPKEIKNGSRDIIAEALNSLQQRDKIIIRGNRPPYASAGCDSNQAFATACLCYGIKAGVQRTITQTRMTTATITEFITKTSSTGITATSTSTAPCTADTQNDRTNCGECGNICSGELCVRGVCQVDQCRKSSGNACVRGGTCPAAGEEDCGTGSCVATDVGNRCVSSDNTCEDYPCEGQSGNCPTGFVCVTSKGCCEEPACFRVLDCPNINEVQRRLFGGGSGFGVMGKGRLGR